MYSSDYYFKFQDGIETRWFTAENPKGLKGAATNDNDWRKRSASMCLHAGESFTMAEAKGRPGVVRRLWFAFPCDEPGVKERLRGMRFDFFWDEAKTPAVSAPFGDFGGQSLGRLYSFKNALFENPEGRNFVCAVPMPFKNSMRLVITNETDKDIPIFYEVDCTFGDKIADGCLYFHSYWNRINGGNSKLDMRDFEFLPLVKGHGRFLGVNFGIVPDAASYGKTWWGEGEVKIYLDGDQQYPTLCGTGTEDYIGTSWGQGKFSNDYTGCPLSDGKHQWDDECGFYRLHIPDPIYFHTGIRATIQQLGGCMNGEAVVIMKKSGIQLSRGKDIIDMDKLIKENNGALYDRHDDWSSCVYFYLDKPENGLPSLASVEERMC